MSNTYKSAGVDIEAGNALVRRIGPAARATERPGMLGGLGGFGGLFDLKAAGYEDPILIAATDGVGTKLRIAIDTGRHGAIGQDLVAMCVNDLVVQGAEPLFFLDYFATGRLSPEVAADVIDGIARACSEAGCGLIGGETAEMPGMYGDGDYDVAGFAVGAVERGGLLTGTDIAVGDVVLGLASSGVHSNGFSLVRRVASDGGLDWTAPAPFDQAATLGEALLTPTRLYVKSCLAAIRAGGVRGLAHITGGGLIENIPRALPAGLGVELEPEAWRAPPVFGWLADAGGIAPAEMALTFNCGIGMAVVVQAGREGEVTAALEAAGETVFPIGAVVVDDNQQVSPKGGWPPGWPGA